MGSSQSSLADRNNGHARHGRLSSNNQREKNKNKKTHASNVNSGRAYEHLTCANDNSARSSPSDVRNSSVSLKDADRKKSPSVACFPCFSCVRNDDDLNSRGVPIPGQNNDSVALLRVSSKLSLRAVELEDENNFSPEKSEPCADEIPSEENLGDVIEQISCGLSAGSPKVEYLGDVDCVYRKVVTTDAFAPEVVVKGNSVSCEKHVQPDSDFDQAGSGRLFVVSKKHLSFPCGLFSHAKSKPIVDGYSNYQLAVMPLQEQITERGNERMKEIDCMSNSTSCEDSGKASESESALLSLEPGRNVFKAPIAKIDSLETTSIDSLNSDDLMVDTMGFSCTSFNELEGKGSRDPVYTESIDRMNMVYNNQKLNHSLHARRGSEKDKVPDGGRPSCSSRSEPKLNKRHPDTFDRNETRNAANDVLASVSGYVTLRETADKNRRVKMTIPGIPGARERKRLSCPSTGTELPFLCFDNLRPTSLDFTGVNRLSGTIQEMPDSPMPVGDEFVVLDRETQDDVMNDIEMCRTLLLDLGVLICQVMSSWAQEVACACDRWQQIMQDMPLNIPHSGEEDELSKSSYLDSKNNNLGYFSMQEEAGKNSLQMAELREDSPSYEHLAMENNELRTKLTSLQMLMIEQQEFITTLENKLAQLHNTRQNTGHNAVADVHSTPLTTNG